MKIYIAGPLFTEGERAVLERIERLCKENGFETFMPHRDAGIWLREEENSKQFFEKDKNAIRECEAMIAVLNYNVDSGTAWEMGYAYSKGLKIVGFIDDARIYQPNLQLNAMIINSCRIVCSFDELKEELKKLK
ncbi:nucleoside 2-deoxyribosyltransferase [archaeon]|nr:nucleoside 2-deoxyribosyltransferase [archaeon]